MSHSTLEDRLSNSIIPYYILDIVAAYRKLLRVAHHSNGENSSHCDENRDSSDGQRGVVWARVDDVLIDQAALRLPLIVGMIT